MRHISLLLVLSALLLPAAASAQSRQELDARLRAVESHIRAEQSQGGAASTVRMMGQMDTMERQIRELISRVEELSYENRQLKQDYETLRDDMMSMIGGGSSLGGGDDYASGDFDNGADDEDGDFEDTGSNGPVDLTEADAAGGGYAIVDPDDPNAEAKRSATRALGSSPVSAADPDILFARAQTRLMEGDYPAARNAFETFVEEAEGDERTGEAWFWVGRTRFIVGESAEAADAYIQSMQAGGPKAPDAMVQLGVALADLGETEDACETLAAVPGQFPDASESVIDAAERESRNAGCG